MKRYLIFVVCLFIAHVSAYGQNTPYPSVGGAPTGSAGGSLTGTYPNPTIASIPSGATATTQAITDNSTAVATTAFTSAHPQFTAALLSNQTGVTSATWTNVTLGTPAIDNKSGWNATNKQYVIPTTGTYRISANAGYTIGTAILGTQQILGIGRNGLIGSGGSSSIVATNNGVGTTGAETVGIAIGVRLIALTAGDTIELDCFITGTTNSVSGDGYETYLSIEWVGP